MKKIDRLGSYLNSITPYTWDDSESWFEFLAKTLNKLNEVVDSVNDYFDVDLKEFTFEKLEEWLEDGTLERILTQQQEDSIQNLMNVTANHETKLANLINVLESDEYNVAKDGVIGTDISDYLTDLIKILPKGKTILLPAGTYHLSKTVRIKDYFTIKGHGEATIVDLGTNGQFKMFYSTTLKNLRIETAVNYSRSAIYIDSEAINSYDKQMINVQIENIRGVKEFDGLRNSIFLELMGNDWEDNPVAGFWGVRASNIYVDGFTTPLTLRIINGWIHANTFSDWTITGFKNAIVLHGIKNDPNRRDDRIRRNRFKRWTIQPLPNTTEQLFIQNQGFPNEFTDIDIWDLTRWDNRFPTGGVPVDNFRVDNVNQPFIQYGYNLQEDRFYPVFERDKSGGNAFFEMEYYQSMETSSNIHVWEDECEIVNEAGKSQLFEVYKDQNGVYYIKNISGSILTGCLIYKASKNLGRVPYQYLREQDLSYNNLTLTKLTHTFKEKSMKKYSYMTDDDFLNGHTGFLYVVKDGRVITITGRINSSQASDVVVFNTKHRPVNQSSIGDLDNYPFFKIWYQGDIEVPVGKTQNNINITYITEP